MNTSIKEHSVFRSIILHLLPGILVGAGYYTLAPLVISKGFPSIMSLLITVIFILIPFELGFLIYQKHKTGEKFLKGIIPYVEPL